LRPSWEVIKETLPWGVLGGAVNALAIILVIKVMRIHKPFIWHTALLLLVV
jgi:hypothetical protein